MEANSIVCFRTALTKVVNILNTLTRSFKNYCTKVEKQGVNWGKNKDSKAESRKQTKPEHVQILRLPPFLSSAQQRLEPGKTPMQKQGTTLWTDRQLPSSHVARCCYPGTKVIREIRWGSFVLFFSTIFWVFDLCSQKLSKKNYYMEGLVVRCCRHLWTNINFILSADIFKCCTRLTSNPRAIS